MGLRNGFFSLLFFLLLLCLGFAAPSSYIKYEMLENGGGSAGRSLLQEKKDCPIDMENQNYTIVTSQCKGPHYDGKICCGAFKELACKNRDALNAENNNCATVLFNYLHLYGKYPAGLFGNLCKEDKNGLDCKQVDEKEAAAAAAAKSGASATTGGIKSTAAVLLVAAASFLGIDLRR